MDAIILLIALGLAVAGLMVGVFLAARPRSSKGMRVVGVCLVLLVLGVASMLFLKADVVTPGHGVRVSRLESWPATAEDPGRAVSQPAEVLEPAENGAYRGAWEHAPSQGSLPAWVKEPRLFSPEFEASPFGGSPYAKQDAEGRLAGYSTFADTPERARAQAWNSTFGRIRALVLAGIAHRAPARLREPGVALVSVVDETIEDRRASLTAASYEDEVVLDYGRAYRAALLANAPPQTIQEIVDTALEKHAAAQVAWRQAERDRRRTWAYTAGGAAFLLLVIVAIYLFLNAHTKGYYSWPLRLLAAALYGGAVLAFLRLMRAVG